MIGLGSDKNGSVEVFILSFTKEFAGMPQIGVVTEKNAFCQCTQNGNPFQLKAIHDNGVANIEGQITEDGRLVL